MRIVCRVLLYKGDHARLRAPRTGIAAVGSELSSPSVRLPPEISLHK